MEGQDEVETDHKSLVHGDVCSKQVLLTSNHTFLTTCYVGPPSCLRINAFEHWMIFNEESYSMRVVRYFHIEKPLQVLLFLLFVVVAFHISRGQVVESLKWVGMFLFPK